MKIKKSLVFVWLLFLIFASVFLITKAKDAKPLLHFVQISDTHLQHSYAKDAERLLGSSEKLLKDTVKQVNDIEDLDFVLFTGDLVDVPNPKLVDKFVEIVKDLNYPFYVLLGNHDVSVDGGLGKKGFIEKFNKPETSGSFPDNMTYYSFSPNKKFTIICLDGTTEEVVTAHGQLDKKQFEWLKNELEANKDKKIIITLHFPLIEPYKSQTHFFLEPDRTNILNLLNSHKNVIGVFSGHYHAARLFKIKNKIHNSCPAVVQYPNSFREITIYQDSPKYLNVDFKWHSVNGEKLRSKSKNSSRAWVLTQGAIEDKEQNIKLKIYKD